MAKLLLAILAIGLLGRCTKACFGGGGFSVGIGTSGPFMSIHDSAGRTGTLDRETIRRTDSDSSYHGNDLTLSKVDGVNSNRDSGNPPNSRPVTDLTISEDGIEFLKAREGFEEKIYPDHKKRLPTIGYGTNCKSHPEICREMIPESGRVDRNLAEQMMKRQVNGVVERTIKNNVKVPLTQNQFDALSSFVYHEGAGNFQSSTLLKKLNAGDTQGAAEEFRQWNKLTDPKTGVKGVEPGFVNRRELEIELFCKNGECDPTKGKASESE